MIDEYSAAADLICKVCPESCATCTSATACLSCRVGYLTVAKVIVFRI